MNKIFFDMDNTLANFDGMFKALERFDNEPNFFFRLRPMEPLAKINEMAKNGNIYIVSASPNIQADIDKVAWLRRYLPNIARQNIIFTRLGINKAEHIKSKLGIEIDKNCILVDDYTKNLQEWENAGGIGIKRISKYSPNSRKIWKGIQIEHLEMIGRFV